MKALTQPTVQSWSLAFMHTIICPDVCAPVPIKCSHFLLYISPVRYLYMRTFIIFNLISEFTCKIWKEKAECIPQI